MSFRIPRNQGDTARWKVVGREVVGRDIDGKADDETETEMSGKEDTIGGCWYRCWCHCGPRCNLITVFVFVGRTYRSSDKLAGLDDEGESYWKGGKS